MTESEFDDQMLRLFDSLRVESDEFRDEFREGLRKTTNDDLRLARFRDDEVKQAHTRIIEQQERLLTLRLAEEIDAETFARKATELRDKAADLRLHLEAADRGRDEIIDIAVKAFELSQNLRAKWFEADYAAKRRILEIICLNWTLDGVNLVPTMRKPFDMLAEGLVWKNSRDDRI
jgi:site-specific DNA recombinase